MMKFLLYSFVTILFGSVLFDTAQSVVADNNKDKHQLWIQSLLDKEYESIDSNDYLFYCTGHHDIIWSVIARDSSKIYLCNGPTRNYLKHTFDNQIDTLVFIENNIATIKWGFDSLAKTAQLFTPVKMENYNPIYNELDVTKNHITVFRHNSIDYYSGPDSANFNNNLNKLSYLMLWLAIPSCRQYLPTPCDTLRPLTNIIEQVL